MKIEVKSNTYITLISSIVLLIIGAMMFTKPDVVVTYITYIISSLIIILGVFKCFKNYLDLKHDNAVSSRPMISGIVLVILGLIFIFLAGVIEALVRYIIGGWILFSGINQLVNALSFPKKDTNFFVLLILSVLLISGGLYTILITNLAFKATGFVLMLYAILEIIGYIFNRREVTVVKIQDVQEAEVVESKTEKKEKRKKKK